MSAFNDTCGPAGTTAIDEALRADRLVAALVLVEKVRPAAGVEQILPLLAAFAAEAGADAVAFVSSMRVDGGPKVFRTLLAGSGTLAFADPARLRAAQDLWLKQALCSSETISSGETIDAADFHAWTTVANLQHQIVVPAPNSHGISSVGALVLSASGVTMRERHGWHRLHIVARAMAMELHSWLVRSSAAQLVLTASIRADDLELLRHEAAGLSSKAISQLMNTPAQTIDCRFQRLSARMGVPTRQAAAQMARLHGLI